MKYLDIVAGVLVTNYVDNNGLALMMVDLEEEEIYGDITVNVGSVPEYSAYLDTNNMPEIEEFITENEIGFFTGLVKQSGFCTYPLYSFFPSKLKELCPEGTKEYESLLNE